MRNLLFSLSILIVLSGVLGCQRIFPSQLDLLGTYLEDKPDSVYFILEELKEESEGFKTEYKMKYGLLRLQCQNSLDIPFDSIDTAVAIAEYYKVNGTYNQALLSLYLLGRAYMERGDEPMAAELFNECLSLKPSPDDEVDYIKLSKVHSQLDNIYSNQNLIQYEINELDLAKDCALKGGDTLLALNYELLKTNAFYKFGQEDSVLDIAKKVYDGYFMLGQKDKGAEALYMAICVYLDQQKYVQAKQCIDIFESQSHAVDRMDEVSSGWEIYHRVKGDYYYGVGRIDSAEYQYRKLLKYVDDINCKEGAYGGLLSIYRTLDIPDSIGKYATLYCIANDSLHAHSLASEVARIQSIYNYSDYKRKAEEMKLRAAENKQRNTVLIFCIFFIILLGLFYILSYRKNKQYEIERLLDEYERTQQVIEGLKGDKEELIRIHKEELKEIENRMSRKGLLVSDAKDSPVRLSLKSKFIMVGDNHAMIEPISTEDWHDLFLDMSNNDYNYMLFLRKSNLSEKEQKIAVLIRLRFADYQIKNILDSYGSDISNYKDRINMKLFKESGTRTLRQWIYNYK